MLSLGSVEVSSLAEWEQMTTQVFAMPEFGEWFSRMLLLVDWGRREFYHPES